MAQKMTSPSPLQSIFSAMSISQYPPDTKIIRYRHTGNIDTVKEYFSLRGLEETTDEIKKGGFPRSVRTDNRSNGIGSQLKADFVYRLDARKFD
jgi:hypothetical protein